MPRSSALRPAAAGLVCMLALTTPRLCSSAPVIDGQLDDLAEFAATITPEEGCGVDISDPTRDIRLFESTIVPCVPVVDDYYPNSVDQTRNVLVYERARKTLYLGLRVASAVGDPDGDGNPNSRCPQSTIEDFPGVGPDDLYEWEFSFDCAGSPEMVVTLTNNTLTVSRFSVGAHEFSIAGGDLEIAIHDAELPLGFDVRVFSGSVRDGMGEDVAFLSCRAPGVTFDLASSAEPEAVCPGGSTTLTIDVVNVSARPLDTVDVTHTLSAGLRYVEGSSRSSGATGAPTLTDGVLAWPTFTLAAGESRTIRFEAIAGPDCSAAVEARSDVMVTAADACSFGGEPKTVVDQSSVSITCTGTPCAPEAPCVASGQGCADIGGTGAARERHTFGGTVEACDGGAGAATGTWQHTVGSGNGTSFRFTSSDACVTSCGTLDGGACASATIAGTGTYTKDGQPAREATFSATIVDRNPAGCEDGRDAYRIEVRDRETGEVVLSLAQQESTCGQLRVEGVGGGTDAGAGDEPELGVERAPVVVSSPVAGGAPELAVGSLPLGAYPNPFTIGTSFGYEVPAGDARPVEIGVFDAAGRLVRRLVSETQPAGRATIRWDGRDAAGQAVAPGIYFLESRTGGEPRVLRLVKLADATGTR